ncbi:GNAT family N-acetyltransferase [Kineococcus rubinsiae]|uniref:GNAT family N-acetyltransferase n=1 Tax=Kineococcus rubinsiae TaxID=2609562 RepID=UPI00142FE6C8|nr:GNAT family N-acetyltransferase [Kineococcus rubinsiae]NIZ91977.1 GNAT family N-acetyltransferase [Kineococcus rubinsiae]
MTTAPPSGSDDPGLDNPVWASLGAAHAHLAELAGPAARYPADVSPFAGLADPADPAGWAGLAALAGPAATVVLVGLPGPPPAGWTTTRPIPGVQMVAAPGFGSPASGPARPGDPAVVELGEADVPAMLDLVERTRPGPFGARTRLLGTYLGIREQGRLVAMAGERLHPPGATEISAVCTDPSVRGRGYASHLLRAVAAGIRARGETPFLHAAADNTSAIRLYSALGFHLRRETTFTVLQSPSA